jgi:hypothetical protein
MKLTAFIIHPYTLIGGFAMIFISEGNTGHFYLFLVVLGLIYGQLYAILGSLGIVIVLASYHFYKRSVDHLEASVVNFDGAVLMIVSLFLFYYHSPVLQFSGNFTQIVHIVTLVTFCLLVSCFVIIYPLQQKNSINHNLR